VIAVLVVWHVRDTEEARAAFLRFWRGRVPVRDRGGLVGEFLCEPVAGIDPRYRTLRFAPPRDDGGEGGAAYVTVGLWADLAAFEREVGPYIPRTAEEAEAFEVGVRRRIVLGPVAWRRGAADLPTSDSEDVA
jgi:hypothetical protein